MKVLAGICLTKKPVSDDTKEKPEVLGLGTGTKTLLGNHLGISGREIIDSHGEIISRRCLKRYFYSELNKHADGLGEESIFEKSSTGGLFKIREHIKFHLYVNTVTCGDARIFNPNANDEFDDFNDARMNRGILRTKIESGEGTIPIPKDFSVLTWDGVIAGERLLTASCSDKVMRWNVLGLQGASNRKLLNTHINMFLRAFNKLFVVQSIYRYISY